MDRIKILKYLVKDFITRYEFSNRDYFTKTNLKSFEHKIVLNNTFKKNMEYVWNLIILFLTF
uniref:Uncharacterized protein n=1 Tax=Moumouvirus sp. 'Monve' TaxID=1128131 RepID=H2EFC9_9VIRU|nr:hypothetical protein mv_R992 [Moumouvirus Monve]